MADKTAREQHAGGGNLLYSLQLPPPFHGANAGSNPAGDAIKSGTYAVRPRIGGGASAKKCSRVLGKLHALHAPSDGDFSRGLVQVLRVQVHVLFRRLQVGVSHEGLQGADRHRGVAVVAAVAVPQRMD